MAQRMMSDYIFLRLNGIFFRAHLFGAAGELHKQKIPFIVIPILSQHLPLCLCACFFLISNYLLDFSEMHGYNKWLWHKTIIQNAFMENVQSASDKNNVSER